jgi:preprotein translocase subunit SecG
MKKILEIILYVDVVFLILAILIQSRGAALSMTFGGDDNFFRKKRGPEKVLFISTIVLASLFVLLSLLIPFSDKIQSSLGF